MARSGATRLAILAALFCLYLVGFFVLGRHAFGREVFYAPSAILALVTAVLVFRMASRGQYQLRLFLWLLAAALGFDFIAQVTFEQDFGLFGGEHLPVGHAAQLWMVPFLLFLFFWDLAWMFLALRLYRRGAGGVSTWLAALVLIGLAVVYVDSYHQSLVKDSLSIAERFALTYAGLELVGLVLGLFCIMHGAAGPFLLLVAGFGVWAGADFLFNALEVKGQHEDVEALHPVWVLGRFLVLGGVLLMPTQRATSQDADAVATTVDAPKTRSGLSGLLVLLSLGSVFAAGAVAAYFADERHWFAAVFVLFVVVWVVLMTRLTGRFDHAVEFSRSWTANMVGNKLEAGDWRRDAKGVRRTLNVTGLGRLLDSVKTDLDGLRDDVVFLGPERLNRPETRPVAGGRITCFLVMPFGTEWAEDVQMKIRNACKAHGVRAVRGDDIYTPTDILDDIWEGIYRAHFIVADITGRNPNVMYELGMAHAIGKPVIILSQVAEDIPIDLGTRRVVLYGSAKEPALDEKLARSIRELLQEYGLRTGEVPSPGASDAADPPSP